MLTTNIVKALEKAVVANTPVGVSNAFDNTDFIPVLNQPYQQIIILFGRPDNITLGSSHYIEKGLLKIVTNYPANSGKGDSIARIQQIRDYFKRGTTFTEGDSKVIIDKTPEIGQGRNLNGQWIVPVIIQWYSEVF